MTGRETTPQGAFVAIKEMMARDKAKIMVEYSTYYADSDSFKAELLRLKAEGWRYLTAIHLVFAFIFTDDDGEIPSLRQNLLNSDPENQICFLFNDRTKEIILFIKPVQAKE